MASFEDLFQQVLVPALITILGAAITTLTGVAIAWLKRQGDKLKAEWASEVIDRASDAVQRAVQATNQKFVDDLRAGHADGKLTRDEAAAAFAMARRHALEQMGTELMIELTKILGDHDAFEGWLSGRIEALVSTEKADTGLRLLGGSNAGEVHDVLTAINVARRQG